MNHAQIRFWGVAPSFAFVAEPETNGVIERFFRTFKEQVVHGRIYQTIDEVLSKLVPVGRFAGYGSAGRLWARWGWGPRMDCVDCGSAAVTERPECTVQGYRRFRCRDCGKQFNERSAGLLNRAQYPSDVIALVVLWRLRYRLTLRDLSEMFLQRGIVFSYEAVREWEAKLAPILAGELRRRRWGKGGARSRQWHVDET